MSKEFQDYIHSIAQEPEENEEKEPKAQVPDELNPETKTPGFIDYHLSEELGLGDAFLEKAGLEPTNDFAFAAGNGYLTGMKYGAYHLVSLSHQLAEAITKIRYHDDKFATIVEPLFDAVNREIEEVKKNSQERLSIHKIHSTEVNISEEFGQLSTVTLFDTPNSTYGIALETKLRCPPGYIESGFFNEALVTITGALGLNLSTLRVEEEDYSTMPSEVGGGIHKRYFSVNGFLLLELSTYQHLSSKFEAGAAIFHVLNKDDAERAFTEIEKLIASNKTEQNKPNFNN